MRSGVVRLIMLTVVLGVLTMVLAVTLGGGLLGPVLDPDSGTAGPSHGLPPSAASEPGSVYGHLPLYFVANQGQTDPRVAYSVSARGVTAFFTPSGVTYAVVGSRVESEAESARADRFNRLNRLDRFEADRPTLERWALGMELVGADPAVQPVGLDQTEAIFSWFKGPPEAWVTAVPSYSGVAYPQLWPGIDLLYGQQAGRLEYRFLLQPGADPSRIQMAFRGAAAARLDEAGQLALTTPMGDLVNGTPLAFQERDGRRVPVDVAWELASDDALGAALAGFRLGAYDPALPLTIDPTVTFAYSGYVGGSSFDQAFGIAVDTSGSAYVTGRTRSDQTSFPVAVGPDLSYGGDAIDAFDAFVAKVNPLGTALVYAGYIGGDRQDLGTAIAVDSQGRAYLTGFTLSPSATFPVTVGPDLTYNGGDHDAFVAKVSADGRKLVYCGYIGGQSADLGLGIAVDNKTGNAYVTGVTSSREATFPVLVGPGLTYSSLSDNIDLDGDAFVAKVSTDGSRLLYAGYIGGAGNDRGFGIAVDTSGQAYVAGVTASEQHNFPVSVGPDLTYNGSRDAFVAKVSTDGSRLLYAGYVGGDSSDEAFGIAVDTSGSAYITGRTSSNQGKFPVHNGPDLTHNGGQDAFVAKVRPDGSGLVYCGYIGGGGSDEGFGIAVDGSGNAYVTGATDSDQTTFPVLVGPDLTYNGGGDAFVAKVNPLGTALVYAGYVGGSASEISLLSSNGELIAHGFGIAVDGNGNAYVTGATASNPFPRKDGPDLTFNGSIDAFISKFVFSSTTGTFQLTPQNAQVQANQHLPLKLTWTVPKHEVWTDLKWIQLRLKDASGIVFEVQWDQQANTFSLVDPASGQLGPAASPGSGQVLQSSRIALYLSETSVVGGGPKAPNVDLNLSLAFQPPTKGQSFTVEVAAANDFGDQQDFAAAGTVTVIR